MGMNCRGRWALTVAVLALVLAAAPAQAGSLSYTDPAGDATAVGNANPPRPSDPELDLRKVSWATTADEVVITTSLTALGSPTASDGWAIGHYFTYEDLRFEILVQDVGTATTTLIGPDGVYLRPAGDSTVEYPCVCRFILHPDRKAVTARVELHSIGSAAKTVDPRLPRPRPGSEFTKLHTTSYRVAGFLLAADRATAPEDAVLKI